MLHLIKYDAKVKLRNFNMTFWPLVFPLILGTLFYVAFGKIDEADFETVPVAVVVQSEGESAENFLVFLEKIETDETELIQTEQMEEEGALKALGNGEIAGIFYVGEKPSLVVGKMGMEESILQTLLTSYESTRQTMERIGKEHPEGLLEAVKQMGEYQEMVAQVSMGGKTTDGNVQFFYALIAMACMYGCFIGFGSAISLQANLTSLAARRCVTPTHKLVMICSEMITCFGLHFLNICVLLFYLRVALKLDFQGQLPAMLLVAFMGCMIGCSMGLFVGSLSKMQEGAKIGIMLAISMACSFLSGLMANVMKDIVERHCPIVNRLNPAAVITDALYCINVYDDPVRLRRSLITLGVMSLALTLGAFLAVRRERYDSI